MVQGIEWKTNQTSEPMSRFKKHSQLSEEDEENVLFILKVFLKLSNPCILTIIHFFLFQLNAHVMLNTYIYYQLPPTCFGVCYTIFREAVALFAQNLYAMVSQCTVADRNC